MDWKDADLTAVVEQVAARHWNTRLKPAGFGAWEGLLASLQHHVRETMLPNVVATHAALEPYVQQLLAQARAQALREAAALIDAAPGSDGGYMPCCTALGDHLTHECDHSAGLSIPDWLQELGGGSGE